MNLSILRKKEKKLDVSEVHDWLIVSFTVGIGKNYFRQQFRYCISEYEVSICAEEFKKNVEYAAKNTMFGIASKTYVYYIKLT